MGYCMRDSLRNIKQTIKYVNMKKQILISLILLCSVLIINAQTRVPNDGLSPIWYNNNNVGIGIENPQYKFMVQGEIHLNMDYPYVQFNSNYWNAGSYIQTGVTTESQPNGDFMVFYNPSLKGFNFCQGSYNALTIHPNKCIGIGTSNPQTLLNVNVGAGGGHGAPGIRIGGLNNYPSLELGIDGDYDGMIRSYGNNINYYAGHWIIKGTPAAENHSHNWYTSKAGSTDWSVIKMTLNQDGNLGIGTTNPQFKLDVLGTIRAREIKVDLNGADFVFEKDYKLMPLNELEKFVKEQKHLPDIAPAKEMEANGTNLGNLNSKLLQKMEEMTLYMIDQNKKIQALEEKIEKLESATK